MPTLHLGVMDIPYAPIQTQRQTPKPRKANARPVATAKRGSPSNMTTGQVANILEAKYHIMEIYAHLHEAFITDEISTSLVGHLENMLKYQLLGDQFSGDPYMRAMSEIQADFKKFLSLREMDGLGYRGIPTKASLMGVSHRFKDAMNRHSGRGSRPSFIDTGQYQASFNAWVTN